MRGEHLCGFGDHDAGTARAVGNRLGSCVSQRGTAGGSDHAADHRGDPARPCKTDLRSRHDPTRLSYATWRLDTPRDIRGNVWLPRPGYHRAAVAARQTDPARDYRRRRFNSSGPAQHHAVRCRYDGTYRQAYFPGDGRLGAAPWRLKKEACAPGVRPLRFVPDSALEEDGFELVWGFSCQVVVLGFC